MELSLKEMYITKSDVCAHNMVVVQKDREPFIMYSGPQERSTFENLLFKGNCIILSSAIVSRKVIDSVKGFTDNEKMLTSEDYEFWVRISKCGFKFCFINMSLGVYLIHSNNVSRGFLKTFESSCNILLYYKKYVENNLINKIKIMKARSLLLYTVGRSFQHFKNKKNATYFYIKSLIYFPFILKTYFAIFFTLAENKLTHPYLNRLNKYFREKYFK